VQWTFTIVVPKWQDKQVEIKFPIIIKICCQCSLSQFYKTWCIIWVRRWSIPIPRLIYIIFVLVMFVFIIRNIPVLLSLHCFELLLSFNRSWRLILASVYYFVSFIRYFVGFALTCAMCHKGRGKHINDLTNLWHIAVIKSKSVLVLVLLLVPLFPVYIFCTCRSYQQWAWYRKNVDNSSDIILKYWTIPVYLLIQIASFNFLSQYWFHWKIKRTIKLYFYCSHH